MSPLLKSGALRFPKFHISISSKVTQWSLYHISSYQFWAISPIYPTGNMNTREQDVIRREQAEPNNADVEKGVVFGPDAGKLLSPDSILLILPSVFALTGQFHNVRLFQRGIR
jgi:hypothetical protein